MARARGFALLLLAAVLPVSAGAQSKSAIVNSKHDFRASSSAAIRSATEQQACVFCHTPHNAAPGEELWNQKTSNTPFANYSSSTMQASVTPILPQDSSKLCLSCHDGTIALGDSANNGQIDFLQGSGYAIPPSSTSNVAATRGFSDDHPFGFVPVITSEIRLPANGDPVRLDANGRVQCTTCHDPHRENVDVTTGKFLVRTNQASALCLTCHVKTGWNTSTHRQPADPSNDLRYTPLQGAHTGNVGVSANGCESCHRPHSPQVQQRLLKFTEENTCFACHDGSVSSQNVRAEFYGKTYSHPVLVTPSVHDAAESPVSVNSLPEVSSGTLRHAECADCHNAHATNALSAQPPSVSGALAGTRGFTAGGTFIGQSNNEYEICFKCHADSANKPQLFDSSVAGIGFGRNPQRQYDAGNANRYNTRIEFGFSPSFHPVTRARNLSTGTGGEVPSLRLAPVTPAGAPISGRSLSASSYIYCTDCHNNDSGRNLGSSGGPGGPHASNIQHLLERVNQLEPPPTLPGGSSPGVAYSASNYALCDKCHDVAGSTLQDRSFAEHSKHIREKDTACSTCHDPHASTSPMLINFDLSVVGPSSSGRLDYRRTGFRHGTCYLTCHGEDHNPKNY